MCLSSLPIKLNAPYKSGPSKAWLKSRIQKLRQPHARNRRDVLMNRKFIVAILLVAAVSMYAHAQNPRVSKGDAQKVVSIITGDKAKTETYCEIQNLGEQMERAYEKRNLKLVDELLQKIDALEETLSEYVALIEGLDLIDPEKDKLGGEFMSILGALDKLCAR
jgi:hypothetical protein